MKKITFILVSLFIFLYGCSTEDNTVQKTFSDKEVKKYVSEAIGGNESANIKLSNLFDYSIPLPLKANKIQVDSFRTSSGKIIYTVLVEHENPIFNRLAIYNNKLRLLLIDKSLNGYLSLSSAEAGKNFIRVNEQFISKDLIRLNRASFYSFDETKASLSFRTFTSLVRNNKEFKLIFNEISDQKITASITAPPKSFINKKEDFFIFDNALGRYSSTSDIFNKFVIEDVKNLSAEVKMPQITDIKSAMQSIGVTSDGSSDTIINTSNFGVDGFGLTLSEIWKELRNVSISSYINTNVKGTRYINNSIGASIFIIPLATEDSSEMFVASVLNQKSEGKYKVRYSEKIEAGKNFVQYFEYTCGTKKYLLILEASKYTYEEYKEVYSEIISTFYMEC